MKFLSWRIGLGLFLIALAGFLYLINYLIFRDWHHMSRLFMGQLGFLPISVLLVTIIVNQLLSQRARRAKLAKMNMVIGAFFSEAGTELLKLLCQADLNLPELQRQFAPLKKWSANDLVNLQKGLKDYEAKIGVTDGNLENLREFLLAKRQFMLRLLENPNLLEHDSFTDLLWAVFHLTEELGYREDVRALSSGDREHLAGDIKRAYLLLIAEWLTYMRHLEESYPYLFSLAVRINPFDPQASPEIK
jgi:hypothetical protein